VRGRADKRFSWVHIDDLADAFVRLALVGGPHVAGQLFNIVSRDYPTFQEILLAAAEADGLPRAEARIVAVPVPESDADARHLETDVVIDPRKAEQVLGWKATRSGLVQEMPIYFKAWKTAKAEKKK